ncbi:MAG: leucine-rich repeat domain-containing protein, partial [Paludibacteraceae bacterium]|nr:leucine-rich repeat domain-containing protein [Paludibacteraceae bacterium]
MATNDFEIKVFDQEWIEHHTNTDNYSPGDCAIIKYLGNEKDVVIPEMVDGHKVISLGAGWNSEPIFADYNSTSDITSVVIPNTVTVIEDNAFKNCTKLTNIVIPDSVTFIGFGVFYNCSSLKEIYIPDTVTVLSDPYCRDWFYNTEGAFEGCSSLEKVHLPAGISEIFPNTFKNCTSLSKIDIPDKVTSIHYSAFENCNKPSQLLLFNQGKSCVWIGKMEECVDLVIPEGVTGLEMYAFSGFSNLKKVYIPDSV